MAGRLGRALLLVVAGASHGCASVTSPAEVMARGERSDYRSSRSPRAAASCVEYNAYGLAWGMARITGSAFLRDGPAAGGYELIYQARGATLMVGQFIPASHGTAFSLWRSPGILGVLHGEGTLEQQIVKGCQ